MSRKHAKESASELETEKADFPKNSGTVILYNFFRPQSKNPVRKPKDPKISHSMSARLLSGDLTGHVFSWRDFSQESAVRFAGENAIFSKKNVFPRQNRGKNVCIVCQRIVSYVDKKDAIFYPGSVWRPGLSKRANS